MEKQRDRRLGITSRTFRPNAVKHRKDGITEIYLNRGQICLINTNMYKRVKNYSWYATSYLGKNYVQTMLRSTRTKSGKESKMIHQFIMPNVPRVDHYNRNGLDNRTKNLRRASKSENGFNCRKYKREATSKLIGVSFCRRDNVWVARITVMGKAINLGSFKTERAAYRARLAGERKYFPNFKRYRGPDKGRIV